MIDSLTPEQRHVLAKMQKSCANRERCISEISQKIKAFEMTDDEVETIVNRLVEDKFIDEQRYADAYVRDKFRFNSWGRVKIKQQLKAKRVPDAKINLALKQIHDNDYQNTLRELLQSKLKHLNSPLSYEEKGKVIRSLQSKGFELDEVMEALERF